jgi:hypothetical protein
MDDVIPWRERPYLSIEQAGSLCGGRSPEWVRRRVVGRQLRAVRLWTGGRMVITVPSLIEFLETVETVAPESVIVGPPKLTLVRNA